MNVAGAFVKPNGMTVNSNSPYLVLKAVYGYVLVFDSNLVVPGAQVNLGKDGAALNSVKQFFNSGQRVPVLDCDFVQGSVIYAEPHAAILLFTKSTGAP